MAKAAAAKKEAAPKKEKAEKKEATPRRSKFEALYPEGAKLTVNVAENPKKEGSASRERFDHYFKAGTIGDYLAAGGTYQDVAYDVGRGFITVK